MNRRHAQRPNGKSVTIDCLIDRSINKEQFYISYRFRFYFLTSSKANASAPETANPCRSFNSPLMAVMYPTVSCFFFRSRGFVGTASNSENSTRQDEPGLMAGTQHSGQQIPSSETKSKIIRIKRKKKCFKLLMIFTEG